MVDDPAFPVTAEQIAKYAIIPPINPKKIGTKYHQRERIFSGYIDSPEITPLFTFCKLFLRLSDFYFYSF